MTTIEQLLIVMSGSGCVQHEGVPIEEILSGDVGWFEPDENKNRVAFIALALHTHSVLSSGDRT